ncbi:hypothetical protein IFM47457_07762 [Aspergillus lentulus]|nr:hypothetical protein IFM47457_07762 [Aspergillus lentulus]
MNPEDTQKIIFQLRVRDDGSYLTSIILVHYSVNSDLITEFAQLLCVQGALRLFPMTVVGILWYISGSIEHICAERRGEKEAAAAAAMG